MRGSASTAAEPLEDVHGRTSDAIRKLALKFEGDRVSIGTLLTALQGGGIGVLIILFALPNAIIPGISFILGAPVVMLGLQLALGRSDVWLPDFMRRRTLPASLFAKITRRAEAFLMWIEKRSRPRLRWLVSGLAKRLLGFYIAVVAAFLMMPVPFGNALPAVGISFMAVGLIEADGKAAAIGILLGFLGAAYIAVVVFAGLEVLKALTRIF